MGRGTGTCFSPLRTLSYPASPRSKLAIRRIGLRCGMVLRISVPQDGEPHGLFAAACSRGYSLEDVVISAIETCAASPSQRISARRQRPLTATLRVSSWARRRIARPQHPLGPSLVQLRASIVREPDLVKEVSTDALCMQLGIEIGADNRAVRSSNPFGSDLNHLAAWYSNTKSDEI